MGKEEGLEQALGKKLQEARKTAGLTQQSLCQKAKISYSTLAKIERGAIKAPSIFTIWKIADIIGISMDDLLGREFGEASSKGLKTSKQGVKFVYFDINGCIVRFFQRAFTRIAADTGASPDQIESAFWQYNDAVNRGEMTMQEFEEALGKKLNLDKVDWERYYLEEVEPVEEVHELLNWAKDHYNIGLLSNIMPGLIEKMKTKGLIPDLPYFAVIDSSEVGAVKPEAKIFEIAAEAAKVKPSEIMLVDDDRSNLMSAQSLGWHVLWFDVYRPTECVATIRSALEF
ncbi:MAG: HAD-IA family hydrolase [bacterium]|nr:HAD-IA family hydrolase [bacterium]